MPLQSPSLDTRTYKELLNEALSRIPVHTPEWTNFNESDPGVTLLELFAFLTENILYRANQIPERNRRKFLSLLGIPLQPASSARGLVTFSNDKGPLRTISLQEKLEVRAGQVPFRTDKGLDVLPVDTRLYYKRKVLDPAGANAAYQQLYALYTSSDPHASPVMYETVQLLPTDVNGVDLSQVVDNSLWIAMLARATDKTDPGETWADKLNEIRIAIAGSTVSLGIVPYLQNASSHLLPGRQATTGPHLLYQIPNPPPENSSFYPGEAQVVVPQYLPLDATAPTDVLAEPGVVEIALPGDYRQLRTWTNVDPFEMSIHDFPPSLEDTNLNNRLITWLRISAPNTLPDESSITEAETPSSLQVRLRWAGINTVPITQQSFVFNELLPGGTGEPDQVMTLARTPVIEHSVALTVTVNGVAEQWQEIGDLLDADAEVHRLDPHLPPGTHPVSRGPTKVFTVNTESGEIHFGDGIHGKRLPYGAMVRASYAYGLGLAGNVEPGAISSSTALPPGLTVTNPERTWGGAEAETVSEGEKQITRYLQHRDRLVTAADFESITLRTPGVDIGRVEIIAGYSPDLAQIVPGNAPGAVTIMVIPKYDPDHPDAPVPDRIFQDTIANYLEPRRLITTEIFICGPVYKPVWVSVGIKVLPGAGVAQVREAVKSTLAQFLSPLPDPSQPDAMLDSQLTLNTMPPRARTQRGWPLSKPVLAQELLAVASRVEGVWLVTQVLIAEDLETATDRLEMNGLELPRLAGMSVTLGDAADLDQVRGQRGPGRPPLLSGTQGGPPLAPFGIGPGSLAGGTAQPSASGLLLSPGRGVFTKAPVPAVRPVQTRATGGLSVLPQSGQQAPTFTPAPRTPKERK